MINSSDIPMLRMKQLRMLDIFVDICNKNNLDYWLDFGTLLGAMRHQGFIPWDDDVDVSMPLSDYYRFIEIAEKHLPNDIFLQTPKTDPGFKQAFIKLRDHNSTFIEFHETESMPYHQGIFIDIFPSYEYPNIPVLLRKIMQRTTVFSRYFLFVTRKRVYLNWPIYQFCKLFWHFAALFKKVAFGQIPEDNGYMYASPLTNLYPLGKCNFEGKTYNCPGLPHEHLSVLYGEHYMIPPNVSNRVPHAKLILPNEPCPQSRLKVTR